MENITWTEVTRSTTADEAHAPWMFLVGCPGRRGQKRAGGFVLVLSLLDVSTS
jgi:hypothetical protein